MIYILRRGPCRLSFSYYHRRPITLLSVTVVGLIYKYYGKLSALIHILKLFIFRSHSFLRRSSRFLFLAVIYPSLHSVPFNCLSGCIGSIQRRAVLWDPTRDVANWGIWGFWNLSQLLERVKIRVKIGYYIVNQVTYRVELCNSGNSTLHPPPPPNQKVLATSLDQTGNF